MNPYFSNMLLGRLPTLDSRSKGRVISFAGSDSDIRLTTGSMRERVLGFLYLNGGPLVARDIAAGIMSNPSRVIKSLKGLIDAGEVTAVKCKGCITEYALTAYGTRICVNLDLKDLRG